jgi:hypothetical protein
MVLVMGCKKETGRHRFNWRRTNKSWRRGGCLGHGGKPHKCRILKFIVGSFGPISVLPIGDSTWRSGSNFANNHGGGEGGNYRVVHCTPIVSLRHRVQAYIREHFTAWRLQISPFWSEENTGTQTTVSFKPWNCRGRDTCHKCTGENTARVSSCRYTQGFGSHTAPVCEPQVHLCSLLPT